MGSVSATSKKQIRAYFVAKCNFVNPNPSLEEMRDIRMCSDKTFLEKVTENTLDIYQSVVDAVLQRSGMSPLPFTTAQTGEHIDGCRTGD
jgi:glutamate dehydrogenase